MNRVFKVIWNRTKSCYVVVAETAKNMTKRSSLSVVFSKMVGGYSSCRYVDRRYDAYGCLGGTD